MRRIYWGNLAFEQELIEPEIVLPADVARRIAEMTASWLAVADEGDGLYCPGQVPEVFWERMQSLGLPAVVPLQREEAIQQLGSCELVPWGWSQPMRQRAASAQSIPDPQAVRRVNSRRFSVGLEQEWECGLAGATWVGSVEECQQAVARLKSETWVLKADFGQAGRETFRGRGEQLPPTGLNWLARRLRQGQGAVLEPWVQIETEVGMQWSVSPTGEISWEGGTWLHSTSRGGYEGTSVPQDQTAFAEQWADVLAVQRAALERVVAAGYFGPVGIDAVRCRDREGSRRVRPMQDLNARWTMGRLALGFAERLGQGQGGTWNVGGVPPAEAVVTAPEELDGVLTTVRSWWISGDRVTPSSG